jgi:hypothetical protein
MAERDLPDGAGHQREAQRQRAVEPRVGERLQQVRRRFEERQRHRCGDERNEQPRRHVPGLARRDERARQRLGRQRALAAEEAVRLPHQDDQQQREGEQVAVRRAEDRHAVALDQPQQQAADDGARHIAHAADHGGHHALERRLEAHRRADVVVVHAHQQAREPAQRGGDGEHRLVHAVDVHAHLLRRVAVLRGGAHGPAELRETQEHEQHRRARDADARDQQVERADGAGADLAGASRAAAWAASAGRG